jgi:hypothetical protein
MNDEYKSLDVSLQKLNSILEQAVSAFQTVLDGEKEKIHNLKETVNNIEHKKQLDKQAIEKWQKDNLSG